MPESGSIQITYPSQVEMTNKAATKCHAETTFGKFENGECKVDNTARLITVKGIFAGQGGYKDEIKIVIEDVKNPATNKEGNGFVI